MLNEHVFIETPRLRLVPYLSCFTEQYHRWMSDPSLLALTESIPLSLEEERENQMSWLMSNDKLTFILLSSCSSTGWRENGEQRKMRYQDQQYPQEIVSSPMFHRIHAQAGMCSRKGKRNAPPSSPLLGLEPDVSSSPRIEKDTRAMGENGERRQREERDITLPPFPFRETTLEEETRRSTIPMTSGAPSDATSCSPLALRPACTSDIPQYCHCSPPLHCGWCDAAMEDEVDDSRDTTGCTCGLHGVDGREVKYERTAGVERGKQDERSQAPDVAPSPTVLLENMQDGAVGSSPSVASSSMINGAVRSGFAMIGDCNLFLLPNMEEEDSEEEEDDNEVNSQPTHTENNNPSHHGHSERAQGVLTRDRKEKNASSSSLGQQRSPPPQRFRRTFEVEVMIAEPRYRQQRLASEALRMLLWYGVRVLGASHFVAKVLESNTASVQLFQKQRHCGGLGFHVLKRVPVFHEIHFGLTVGTSWARRVKWLKDWKQDWGRVLSAATTISIPTTASNQEECGRDTERVVGPPQNDSSSSPIRATCGKTTDVDPCGHTTVSLHWRAPLSCMEVPLRYGVYDREQHEALPIYYCT